MILRHARLSGPLVPNWIRIPLDFMRTACIVPGLIFSSYFIAAHIVRRVSAGSLNFTDTSSWPVVGAVSVIAGVLVYLACRRVVRLRLRTAVAARFLACTYCGHSLIKIAPLLVCPECGKPASRTHNRVQWLNAARWFWGRPRKGARAVH